MSLRNLNRIFLITLLTLLSHLALAADNNVTLYEQRRGSVVTLIAKLNNISEATVSLTANLENMSSSATLPLTIDISNKGETVLTTLTPINPGQPYSYTWQEHWKYGHRLMKAPAAYLYSLPYRSGPFRVLQGANGSFSHYSGSQDEQAVDFEMPTGTTIYAARPGTVIAFRSDCLYGSADVKMVPDFNYVIIKHDDGTYAEYLHLRKDGVQVHLGDKVTLGQPIAYSGNTGYTTEPQLHFAVFYTLDGYVRRTVPITFKSTEGQTFNPEAGATY